jgi:hypothetical protein
MNVASRGCASCAARAPGELVTLPFRYLRGLDDEPHPTVGVSALQGNACRRSARQEYSTIIGLQSAEYLPT